MLPSSTLLPTWLLMWLLLLLLLQLPPPLVLRASLKLLQVASYATHRGANWPLSPQHFALDSVATLSCETQFHKPEKQPSSLLPLSLPLPLPLPL